MKYQYEMVLGQYYLLLYCCFSKGSIIANYRLILKKASTLEELTQTMRDYLNEHNGNIGSFKVNADSVTFSGMPLVPCIRCIGAVITLRLVYFLLDLHFSNNYYIRCWFTNKSI